MKRTTSLLCCLFLSLAAVSPVMAKNVEKDESGSNEPDKGKTEAAEPGQDKTGQEKAGDKKDGEKKQNSQKDKPRKKPEPMGPGLKPTTPVIPGTNWVVHDGTRPQPVAVKGQTALTTPPPEDAVVLFDGSSTDAWLTVKGEPCTWEIKEGVLVAKKPTIVSKQEFGDVQVHLEWRIPADRKVNGQGGGNSGIFLMRRYEVQILQSHGNLTYPDGTAGAIYGQYPPLVNATLPQGEWQSFDIAFRAPRYNDAGSVEEPAVVTVLHNGVLVQNAVEIMGPTVFRKLASYPEDHPEKAPLLLQWHGDPVEFRNIWVRELK